jgi:large subunit ribosomal protein L19|uniref:Large ribosomal subunit protein bL19 n=1 Tax=Caldisericum exile TaxID=693075 RepID=A0A7C4XYM1_9BACT
MQEILKEIEKGYLKEHASFNVGDTVRVHTIVKEGEKERVQVFEGIVIAKKGGGINETFTVRKVSYGVGVERVFLLHSPLIKRIEVKRKGDARRAKLYYLRKRVGKAQNVKEKVETKVEETKDETTEEQPEV